VTIVLAVFGDAILLLNTFSITLQRGSLTAPLVALLFGIAIDPYGLEVVTLEMFGGTPHVLLGKAARITLALFLLGVVGKRPPM
jgi:hypothetical protein